MTVTGRGALALESLLACLAAASLAGNAFAGCISQTVGTTTIHDCDSKISTSLTVGTITVHNFDGKLGTSQTVGNRTVLNAPAHVWRQIKYGTEVNKLAARPRPTVY